MLNKCQDSILMEMAKRTRKDKESANYDYLIKWQPSSVKPQQTQLVKGELKKPKDNFNVESGKANNAKSSANPLISTGTKRDLFKSVILASLILCLEVMVYFLSRKTV